MMMISNGMEFILDSREQKLRDYYANDQRIKVEQLDIGDFHAVLNNQVECIVERKTTNDLAQSIVDGRYREQKARLLSCRSQHPLLKIIYVIEGTYSYEPSYKVRSLNNNILSSSLINMMLRDGIFIVNTKNISETCEFLNYLMDKLSKDPEKYFAGQTPSVHYTDICAKTRKKDNIDKHACLQLQLSVIPGISSKKARDIISYYQVQSIHQLCNAVNYETLVKVDGIGSKTAKVIMEYLT